MTYDFDDPYNYDEPEAKAARDNFIMMFGPVYGAHLARQVHEGAVGINRFIMCDIGPRIWGRDKLDMKTRMFVAIASLATLAREDVKFFIRGAFCNGATREEVEEVLLVTGQEAGYPCAALAGRRLDEAEREHLEFMAAHAAWQKEKEKQA